MRGQGRRWGGGGVRAGCGVAGIASSSISSGAAKSAAATQSAAALEAQEGVQNQQTITNANLQPFTALGTTAEEQLANLTGNNAGGDPLTSPLLAPYAAWKPDRRGA